MPRSTDSEENEGSSLLAKWCKCQCGKIRMANKRCFMAPPLITIGSSLAEFVIVFTITGFMAIDVTAVSAICFSILLSFAILLFIRFDKLTMLAFLMLFVSLLSSTTFFIICIQKQTHVHYESGSAQLLLPFHKSLNRMDNVNVTNRNQSRHGSKLTDLMKAGTELRWLHQIQAKEHCCGFWNFTDWIGDSLLLEANKTFKYHSEPIHPPTKWMVSCCDRNLTQDHSACKAESIYDDWHDIVQYLFQKGCGPKLDDRYDEVNYELFKTSLGLSFWDLILAVDLIIYTTWKKLKSKGSNNCNGRGGVAADDDDVFT